MHNIFSYINFNNNLTKGKGPDKPVLYNILLNQVKLDLVIITPRTQGVDCSIDQNYNCS